MSERNFSIGIRNSDDPTDDAIYRKDIATGEWSFNDGSSTLAGEEFRRLRERLEAILATVTSDQ